MRSLKRKVVIDLGDAEHLLINPYSGLADIIDSETLQLLLDDNIDALPEEARSFLKKRGQLMEEGEEKDHLYHMKMLCKTLHKKYSQYNTHIIAVTYECNLRCPYCFERHLYRKGSKWMQQTMDEKTVDILFKTILHLDSETDKNHPITLYGGEPLQLKNLPIVEYILKKGNESGYTFSILSNGADLYHFVPLLSQFRVKEVLVTLDGPKKVHDQRRYRKGKVGTFDDIVKGVDAALDHGVSVGIRVNTDSSNIEDLPEFAQFCREKGWDSKAYLNVVKVSPSECADHSPVISQEEFEEAFLELLLKDERMGIFLETFTYPHILVNSLFGDELYIQRFWNCDSHASTLIYDPSGDIYPCYETVGDEKHKIGEYIPELKFNNNLDQWRTRTVFTIPECRECNLAFFCGGGCAYAAYKSTGSIAAPYCEKMKASIKYEIPFVYSLMKRGIDLSKVKRWPRASDFAETSPGCNSPSV